MEGILQQLGKDPVIHLQGVFNLIISTGAGLQDFFHQQYRALHVVMVWDGVFSCGSLFFDPRYHAFSVVLILRL